MISTETGQPELIAYRTSRWPRLRLTRAPLSRPWMEATGRFAQRCLPLLMANQAGWFILNSHPMQVVWDGGEAISSLRLIYLDGYAPYPAKSHFGFGILTWEIPYLFRTPAGYNLLVRGPSNQPKDGIYPLEGLVETDWAVATFTMNWKLTRPDVPVTFEVDEPICMLVPQRRSELEAFQPAIRDIEAETELQAQYQQWGLSRTRFLNGLDEAESGTAWQRHYFTGQSPGGLRAPEHQLKLKLRDFEEIERPG